jgi:serine/threonine-protein kinase
MGARSATSGGRDIYGLRLGVDTALTPLVVTPYDENAFAISPDGRWIAYQSDESGRFEVFVRPFPNTRDAKFPVSTSGAVAPLWARNGKELYFLGPNGTMMAAAVTGDPSRPVGDPHALFQLKGALTALGNSWYIPWDVAADGRFIMVRGAAAGHDAELPLIVIENWFEELKAKMAAAK